MIEFIFLTFVIVIVRCHSVYASYSCSS